MRERKPPWLAAADGVIARAMSGLRALAAATPVNAAEERERILAWLERGEVVLPAWRYRTVRVDEELRAALRVLEKDLARERAPLAELYRARAAELLREAEVQRAIGTRAIGHAAAARFTGFGVSEEATRTAEEWIDDAADAPLPEGEATLTDARDPRSLLSRMRAEVGRRRLPFTVEAHAGLLALAATGERSILVATGREADEETTARTVLHEIEGHAMPRARAAGQPLRLFALGTAGGTDQQEGWALLLERRHGLLGARRKRDLAARHLAAVAMRDGATFPEVVRASLARGLCPRDAVSVAERVFRGGDGRTSGLGRERVYLEALIVVGDHLADHPEDEALVSSGQVAIDAVEALRPWRSTATGALGDVA